jgi:four helix bundle protein
LAKSKRPIKTYLYTLQDSRDYGFKDQIQRASVSIMNNIAEGFERRSNKELRQFLFIAKGSAGELRSMLHLAIELNYLTKNEFDEYHEQAIVISKMLSNFIKTL